jgi:hypothetical protein
LGALESSALRPSAIGPTSAMTHLAVTGMVNGRNVTWREKVTHEQYNAALNTR